MAYAAGKWGQALALPANGVLKYPQQYNLPLDEGTIEMWVALRADGNDPRYTNKSHYLFFYQSGGNDYMLIGQSRDAQILYAGGVVNGQWQSAYGQKASMAAWKAGEWHHLAFTYSASGNFMRFYVDGILTADTNEGHYWPPTADGTAFAIGGSPWWGNVADYWIDAVRISGRAASPEEIAARAERTAPPRSNEIWLPTALLTPSDSIVYEFTPVSANGQQGTACTAAPVTYPGIPILDPDPPSTLLPPGATAFTLTVQSLTPTRCAYSVNADGPYDQMTPFGEPTDAITHTTSVSGLNPDPNTLNDVYVRCASHPDFRLRLRYRVLSQVNPSFPRTGNLWGWWEWRYDHNRSLEYMAQVDLWLGVGATADEIRALRQLNPHIRILTSINAVENNDIPTPDYYLKDVNGNPIEVWPGSYRLNLTRPEVAEYQARYAYQSWLSSGMQADGVFFDNVMLTQSWLRYDIYGNPVRIDANGDGVEDDPAWLDAAWKAGVLHEMRAFRRLMPYAVVSGHLDDGDPAFRVVSGTWTVKTYSSGEWKASGPFYHAWKTQLHEMSGANGEVRWPLPIQHSDTYTITAWWPAAPAATGWNSAARYEVVQGGQVLASATLDQRQGGDEWHLLAIVPLNPAQNPFVRLLCSGAPCVADALHVRSAARYNNGQTVSSVTLAPLDGIILERLTGRVYLPSVCKQK